MKLVAFLLLLPFAAFSQSDSLPKNAQGIYELTEVVQLDSVSAANLYSRAKKFVAINFNSGKAVTQLNDDNTKTVIGKGVTTALVNPGIGTHVPINVDYTFTIQCKDNRYKYSITDFLVENSTSAKTALEDDAWQKKKMGRKMFSQIEQHVYSSMTELQALLKKSMAEDNSKDW